MGIFEQFKGSITEWSLYSKVVNQRTVKTLKYFFIVFSILFLITGIKTSIGLNTEFQRFATEFNSKIPDFSLAEGEFSFSGEQPYIIEGQNSSIFIIDTTGETDESALENYIDGVHIAKHQMFLKQQGQLREISFADFKNTNISKDDVVNFLPKLKWFIPLIMLVGYVVQVIGKFLSAVFLAFVGMFVNNGQKGNLKFEQLWNLSIYALTLPIILETLVKLVYPQLPYFVWVYYAVAIIYIVKAVHFVLNNPD